MSINTLSMFRNIILFSLLFLSCCKKKAEHLPPCDDGKPDLIVPEYLTPDIIRKNINPYDFTGLTYRNIQFYSNSWSKHGPYFIPMNFMVSKGFIDYRGVTYFNQIQDGLIVDLNFQYFDPISRFRIVGRKSTDNGFGVPCFIVYFYNGLWNNGGYVYDDGLLPTPLAVGETFIVNKFVFNEPGVPCREIKDNSLYFIVGGAKAQDVQTDSKSTVVNIKPNESDIVQIKTYTPPMKDMKFVMTATKFKINKPNYYFSIESVIADIDNEVDEANENNNTQMSTSNLNNGSKSVFYIRSIDSKSTHYDKSLPFVSLVSDN